MTRFASPSYTIGRSSGMCAATGRPLLPGDRCVVALVERGADESLERLDFAEEAWDRGARPERLLGFWRTVMPAPNARPKPFIDDEALLGLFEQLAEAEEARRVAFRFVLALILIRKRLLRHEGSRRDGARSVMLVRRRGPEGWGEGEPLQEVVDPDLNETVIGEVTEQLSAALAGGEA